jgi:hypothetical protein
MTIHSSINPKKAVWVRLTDNSWYDFNHPRFITIRYEDKVPIYKGKEWVVYSPTKLRTFNTRVKALNFVKSFMRRR